MQEFKNAIASVIEESDRQAQEGQPQDAQRRTLLFRASTRSLWIPYPEKKFVLPMDESSSSYDIETMNEINAELLKFRPTDFVVEWDDDHGYTAKVVSNRRITLSGGDITLAPGQAITNFTVFFDHVRQLHKATKFAKNHQFFPNDLTTYLQTGRIADLPRDRAPRAV